MKLPTIALRLPGELGALVLRLQDLLSQTNGQINLLTEGTLAAVHNARTAAPTTGTWAQGDVIRNATPAEAGSAGSKYVVTGWICTASGAPGTWLQCRVLTGN